MFSNLPESVKFKEDNKKRLACLAVISIMWLLSLSTSVVANIIFYDAKLEEPLCAFTLIDPPLPAPSYSSTSGYNYRDEFSQQYWSYIYFSRQPRHTCNCQVPVTEYIHSKQRDRVLDNNQQVFLEE